MMVTTGGRASSGSGASSTASLSTCAAYSSSRTASKPNAEAMSSIWSKSSRWLTVTMRPSSLNANWTIWVAGTFIAPGELGHGDELVDPDAGLLLLPLLGQPAGLHLAEGRLVGATSPSGPRPFMPCRVRRMLACTAS